LKEDGTDDTVHRISASALSFSKYLNDYALPSKPFLLTDCTQGWQSSADWASLSTMRSLFRDCTVNVVACELGRGTVQYGEEPDVHTSTFGQFCDDMLSPNPDKPGSVVFDESNMYLKVSDPDAFPSFSLFLPLSAFRLSLSFSLFLFPSPLSCDRKYVC
jgi:hypothetical protein